MTRRKPIANLFFEKFFYRLIIAHKSELMLLQGEEECDRWPCLLYVQPEYQVGLAGVCRSVLSQVYFFLFFNTKLCVLKN